MNVEVGFCLSYDTIYGKHDNDDMTEYDTWHMTFVS